MKTCLCKNGFDMVYDISNMIYLQGARKPGYTCTEIVAAELVRDYITLCIETHCPRGGVPDKIVFDNTMYDSLKIVLRGFCNGPASVNIDMFCRYHTRAEQMLTQLEHIEKSEPARTEYTPIREDQACEELDDVHKKMHCMFRKITEVAGTHQRQLLIESTRQLFREGMLQTDMLQNRSEQEETDLNVNIRKLAASIDVESERLVRSTTPAGERDAIRGRIAQMSRHVLEMLIK